MRTASVTDEYRPLLDAVAGASIAGALVDSVLVVETTACRVQLNQLVTHGDVWDLRTRIRVTE